ncbi:MAG: S46 family peptidase [Bacteroidales bacterium]|nr:S46 family peptidase [Bacteroidales bacterium]
MSRLVTLFLCLFLIVRTSIAGEGMWLPILLSQLNEKDMQTMGMRITAEDIYSVNHSSLKDAIVLFGGGCTAEIVSNQGLILTNHHCGFSNIQRHSTLEHDYLTDGFWASSLTEELPNPGLSVTFLVSMEDVTEKILQGISPDMKGSERDAIILKNRGKVESEASKGSRYKASVKAFYSGNQFYLIMTETFTDIRLVGAPPSNIGKFGGDTDNWMWPRHTGDFSVFRIYANKNNEPADFSKDNIPYTPKKSLTISLKGVKEGDFTFVYGFPGTTQEYLPSYAVDMAANQRNPIAIKLRQQKLDLIDKAMENDKLTRIQYAAKAASVANFWKKMIGESKGINRLDAIEKKQQFEAGFEIWVNAENSRKDLYGNILTDYRQSIEDFRPYHKAYTYLTEGAMGVEIIRFAYGYNNLLKQCREKTTADDEIIKSAAKLKAGVPGYFKNYNSKLDEAIFAKLMETYGKECDPAFLPPIFTEAMAKYEGSYKAWAADVFKKSMFADSSKMNTLLDNFTRKRSKKIEEDPAFLVARSVYAFLQDKLVPVVNSFYLKADSLQRVYMKAQMEMQTGKVFYPDANSTLRVAYGNVKGYSPADAVDYRWFTTLDGILEKENPDVYDYVVTPRLRELSTSRDYGRYADADGSMHVAFIATNHTTGGNSGSPVLDADGNLVGINFDRCWEGTMSDLIYDPDQCRNIALDIRYCLFIIDRYAGAANLIKEMNFATR